MRKHKYFVKNQSFTVVEKDHRIVIDSLLDYVGIDDNMCLKTLITFWILLTEYS